MARINNRIPTIDEFRPAVLSVLANGEELSLREVCEAAADALQLSGEARAETVPSGQPRYINRASWACSSFAHAGLLERPKRGHYRITEDGKTVARRNLREYTERDMFEWSDWATYQQEVAARRKPVSKDAETSLANIGNDSTSTDDPVEVMELAEQAFNAETETDLRRKLQEASPEFFEKAVIDVLWAMGYGGTHGEKRHVGRTGDGGIDGIIRQDALGLTNVYVQAKRYADSNNVKGSEIREFIGALDSRGANLGVFITTAQFTPSAKTTAENYRHGTIVLVDGIKLTSLMLNYGVAVHKTRQFSLYDIDDDFFEQDMV